MMEPCWEQITAIENFLMDDRVVSILAFLAVAALLVYLIWRATRER